MFYTITLNHQHTNNHLPPTELLANKHCVCFDDTNTRSKQSFADQPSHLYVCDKMKGHMKHRHDVIRNVLCKLFNDIGTYTTTEPQLSCNTSVNEHGVSVSHQPMRADLYVQVDGIEYYVDISVVCPSGNEYVNQYGSDKHALKACGVQARDKCNKYKGPLPSHITDDHFIPLVMETYGGINDKGDSFIKHLCTTCCDTADVQYNHIMNVLSATLQMCNGQMSYNGLTQHRINNTYHTMTLHQYHQERTMYTLQQYVSNVIDIDWSTEQRCRNPIISQHEDQLNI